MRHAGTQELETDRLFLRRLLPEDADMMYANWASDPQVTRLHRTELVEQRFCHRSAEGCDRVLVQPY